MIVVTGATGKLGSAIVEQLLQRVPADQVGVSVRSAARASALAARGVRVREASFDDPEALRHAFEDADRVLVISTDVMGDANVAACTTAIDAARAAGAQRVLYTSHQGCSHDSAFQACRDHACVEDHLASGGGAWTSLRNGFYAASAIQFAEHGLQYGDVAVPADGPVSWTTHADLAEAAAVLLTGAETFEGPTPPLTSQRTDDFAGIARTASQVSGRRIGRTVVPDEAFIAQMTGYGTPEVVAHQLLGIFQAARAGEFDVTDPTLGRLLGRQPQTIDDLVRPLVQA